MPVTHPNASEAGTPTNGRLANERSTECQLTPYNQISGERTQTEESSEEEA